MDFYSIVNNAFFGPPTLILSTEAPQLVVAISGEVDT